MLITPQRHSAQPTAEAAARVLALVLAGGSGTRMRELTRYDSKPAIPFGGSYRNIDFTLSNCVNSGVRRVAVLTQYKSQSLIEHLHEGWSWLPRQLGEFVDAWPAQQRVHGGWYGGTADAVYQNVDLIRRQAPPHVLVLAGDHVYRMDYRHLLEHHQRSGADATIACVEMPRRAACQFGVVQLARCGQVARFAEKPCAEELRGSAEHVLVSMGIYVFRTEVLLDLLDGAARSGSALRDFGADVLPRLVREGRVRGWRFRDPSGERPGYWRDVGTIDDYWLAHMELLSPRPPLDLADPAWPLWTRPLCLPPARVVQGAGDRGVCNALLSPGCAVIDATVRNSVLSPGVVVEPGAVVEDSVLLNDCVVGRGARVRRAVVDCGVHIPAGAFVGERASADTAAPDATRGRITLVHTDPPASMPRAAHEAA